MKISCTHEGTLYDNMTPAEAASAGVPAALVISVVHQSLGKSIDTAAGAARAAFVSPGSHIDQEYLLAKQEAKDWLNSGKDESSVPSSVADHVAMTGQSAEDAAQEIVSTAAQWEQALGLIRRARLGGKTAVRSAETIEAAEAAAQEAIAALNAIRPPEGAL